MGIQGGVKDGMTQVQADLIIGCKCVDRQFVVWEYRAMRRALTSRVAGWFVFKVLQFGSEKFWWRLSGMCE